MSFEAEDEHFKVLLHPGTLYIMAGESRFRFTHAIRCSDQTFMTQAIDKDRRISVMLRDFAEGTDFR
jgi:alkylated DNA repair dioxygenase AlkB